MPAIRDLDVLLALLHAERNPGVYVFCQLPPGTAPSAVPSIGLFQEREGLSAILPEDAAAALGIEPSFRAAWITLTVHSDLQPSD